MVAQTNKDMSQSRMGPTSSSMTLPVVETFHSVQGEGSWVGTNAFFIRLAGCDVGCLWCDTKHSWPINSHPHLTIDHLVDNARQLNPGIVVITGGEPLMHNLDRLTQGLKGAGLQTHLETSGSHPFSGTFDWVTFSPKPFKSPHPSIYPQASELKVVIAGPDDLLWAEVQASLVPETTIKRLQPEWDDPSSMKLVFEYVVAHPAWRVSLQTHKFMDIR